MRDIATQINVRSAASLMMWWRDAGVTSLVDEIPDPWIGRHDQTIAPAAPSSHLPSSQVPSSQVPSFEVSRVDSDQPASVSVKSVMPATAMPQTLAAFTTWLMTSTDIVAAGPPAQRTAPQGRPDCALMIVTDLPEAGDRDTLLGGPVGILFDNMIAAMGRDRSSLYLASVAPARPATGMISDDHLLELGMILRHHVALVAPKSLWLMGRAPSRAILAMSEVEARGRLHKFNHDGGTTNVMASLHPRTLFQSPHRKAAAWADMQNFMQGMTL